MVFFSNQWHSARASLQCPAVLLRPDQWQSCRGREPGLSDGWPERGPCPRLRHPETPVLWQAPLHLHLGDHGSAQSRCDKKFKVSTFSRLNFLPNQHMLTVILCRFYFYCGGVYYMNAMYNLKRLGKLKVQLLLSDCLTSSFMIESSSYRHINPSKCPEYSDCPSLISPPICRVLSVDCSIHFPFFTYFRICLVILGCTQLVCFVLYYCKSILKDY